MNPPNRTFRAFALVLFAALVGLLQPLASQADTFSGSFLATINEATAHWLDSDGFHSGPIEGLPPGSTFSGLYAYESDTIDGTFSAAHGGTLSGSISLPSQFCPYDHLDFATMNHPAWLTVTNGIVTAFAFSVSYGSMDANFNISTFGASCMALGTNMKGGLAWNNPTPVAGAARLSFIEPTASVPDIAPSVFLLALGLAGIGLTAHWARRLGRPGSLSPI